MNRLAPSFFLCLVVAAAWLPAQADIYYGTFTGTITTFTGTIPVPSGYNIGDTFSGYYLYESPTADVNTVFNSALFPENNMGVYLPNELWRPSEPAGGFYFDKGTFSPFPELTVVDGHVTDFVLSNQTTAATYGFNETVWEYRSRAYLGGTDWFGFSGTVAITDPVRVPDSASTALLLLVGMLGLATAGRDRNADRRRP